MGQGGRRDLCAQGFGVSRPAHVRAIAKAGAGGVIVASALVDALGPDGTDVAAMERLVRDLADRSWHSRYASLLTLPELDVGYRLVVAELG